MSPKRGLRIAIVAVLLVGMTSGCIVNSGSNELVEVKNEMSEKATVTVTIVSENETLQTKTYALEPGEEERFKPEYKFNRTVVVDVGSRSESYDWMGGRLDININSTTIEFYASDP